MTVVLDSSALLALIFGERGAGRVASVVNGAIVPAPQWAEVLQKVAFLGRDPDVVGAEVLGFGVNVEMVDQQDAERAAALWAPSTSLSLADRFCLAVAERLGAGCVTADRMWAKAKTTAKVALAR